MSELLDGRGLLERLGSYEPWTVDDLPDDDRRWELVDGVPIVSPAPAVRHALTVTRLMELLRGAVDPQLMLQNAGVGVREIDHRVPDLVVVRAGIEVDALPRLLPEHIQLAVEVVSPSSVTTDRITKPAQYAAWGIEAFWRVETEPVSLTAMVLRPGADVYTEVDTWASGETVDLVEPFAARFELDGLTA